VEASADSSVPNREMRRSAERLEVRRVQTLVIVWKQPSKQAQALTVERHLVAYLDAVQAHSSLTTSTCQTPG